MLVMRAMKCMFVGIYLLVIAAFCLMVGTMYNLSAVAFVCLTCAVLSPVFFIIGLCSRR